MIKSSRLDQTQLVEAGVTPQYAFEITFLLSPPDFFIRLSGRLGKLTTPSSYIDRRRQRAFTSHGKTRYILGQSIREGLCP
jgi:hypothetical protein